MAEPVRYYFDQHIWAAVASALRRSGVDVLTAQDAGVVACLTQIN